MLLAVLAFGPALNAPLDFDDAPAIIDNPSIQRLWPLNDLFAPQPLGAATAGRPVVNVSFALNLAIDRALGFTAVDAATPNNATIGFHLANLLIHVATALLLLGVIRRGLGFVPRSRAVLSDDAIAIIASTIWLVHPIQTEAVDYVAQRTELFVSFFYAGALYAAQRAWIAANGRSARLWIAASIALCAAGMASKEVMILAPLVIALFDFCVVGTSPRSMWADRRRRALYLGLAASTLICLALVATGTRGHSAGFSGSMPWWRYFYSQGWAIAHYLQLIVWPANLAFDYGRLPVAGLRPLAGFVVLATLGAATVASIFNRRWRQLGFLGIWFFLLLAPSSSFVPIHTEIAAERRIYLAFAAVVVAIVAGSATLYEHRLAGTHRHSVQRYATVLLIAVVATLTFLANRRSAQYRSLEGRWRDAVRVTPANGRAYDNLASALLREEPPRITEADSVLRLAASNDPTFMPAYFRRATIATSRNQLALAESLLVKALELEPGYTPAVDRLGRVLVATGRPREAVHYLNLVAGTQLSAESFTQLGAALLDARDLDSAVVVLRLATRLNPSRVDTHRYLGTALVELNRGREALPVLQETVRLDPSSAMSLALLSVAAAQSAETTMARQAAGTAALTAPNDAAVNVLAGRASQMIGLNDDAIEYFQRALRVAPSDSAARAGLAAASHGPRPRR